jgi:hypothetical protein
MAIAGARGAFGGAPGGRERQQTAYQKNNESHSLAHSRRIRQSVDLRERVLRFNHTLRARHARPRMNCSARPHEVRCKGVVSCVARVCSSSGGEAISNHPITLRPSTKEKPLLNLSFCKFTVERGFFHFVPTDAWPFTTQVPPTTHCKHSLEPKNPPRSLDAPCYPQIERSSTRMHRNSSNFDTILQISPTAPIARKPLTSERHKIR